MSKDLNQCNFIGRLGRDVESKSTPSGTVVANFSIACGDDYKDKQTGQKVEQTNWVRVVAFGRLAEIMAQYLAKGSRVYISGKQVTRKWQDNNGQDRYSTEIVANEMQMLDTKGDSGGNTGQPANNGPGGGSGANAGPGPVDGGDFDDDIPF